MERGCENERRRRILEVLRLRYAPLRMTRFIAAVSAPGSGFSFRMLVSFEDGLDAIAGPEEIFALDGEGWS
jgi:hypothetical protein